MPSQNRAYLFPIVNRTDIGVIVSVKLCGVTTGAVGRLSWIERSSWLRQSASCSNSMSNTLPPGNVCGGLRAPQLKWDGDAPRWGRLKREGKERTPRKLLKDSACQAFFPSATC